MAFLTVEDRYAEMEVIVFARQYQRYSSEIFNENAVLISGTLSFEDGDEVRLILGSVEPLRSNTDTAADNESEKSTDSKPQEKTIYVKLPTIKDKRTATLSRMSLLNPGVAKVVVYDSETKKYSVMKDVLLSTDERVIHRLVSVFGEGNIVLK